MGKFLNLSILLLPLMITADEVQKQQANSSTTSQVQNSNSTPNDRKLVFSPYTNLTEDYSANKVDAENSPIEKTENSTLGPFQNTPIPSYGLGGMMPPSLGLTHQPLNYMYGSPMTHPMNPAHPVNQAAAAGIASMAQTNGVGNMNYQNVQPMNRNLGMNNPNNLNMNQNFMPIHKGFDELNDFNEIDDFNFNDDLSFNKKLGKFNFGDKNDGLVTQCKNTHKQAIQISNVIMRRQNKVIYKTLMNYLLKSKYLLTMTEIKLTRVLRKKIYALMNEYSSITEDNIEFIPIKRGYELRPKVTENGIEDSYNNWKEKDIDVGEDYDSYAPGFEGVLDRK